MNINDFKEWLLEQEHMSHAQRDGKILAYTKQYFLFGPMYEIYINDLEIIKITEGKGLNSKEDGVEISLEELIQKVEVLSCI